MPPGSVQMQNHRRHSASSCKTSSTTTGSSGRDHRAKYPHLFRPSLRSRARNAVHVARAGAEEEAQARRDVVKVWIDRAKWNTAERFGYATLRNGGTHVMCCLGFLGLACGVDPFELQERP